MGVSLIDGRPVAEALISALPRTLLLTLTSVLATIFLSVPLGVLAAIKQNRVMNHVIGFLSFLGNALPNFLVSLMLLYFIALKLKLLPILASDTLKGLILPTTDFCLAWNGLYGHGRTSFLNGLASIGSGAPVGIDGTWHQRRLRTGGQRGSISTFW